MLWVSLTLYILGAILSMLINAGAEGAFPLTWKEWTCIALWPLIVCMALIMTGMDYVMDWLSWNDF